MPFSDVESLPERLGPGEHKVWIVGCKPDFSKNKGTPCINVRMVDAEGDFIEDQIWLSPKALPMFKSRLKATGFTDAEMAEYPCPGDPDYALDVHEPRWVLAAPKTRSVMVMVGPDDGGYMKVKGYWKVGKAAPQMREKQTGGGGYVAPPGGYVAPPGETDDDPPFATEPKKDDGLPF
jgi:hypothetical protein